MPASLIMVTAQEPQEFVRFFILVAGILHREHSVSRILLSYIFSVPVFFEFEKLTRARPAGSFLSGGTHNLEDLID
jgi:hypothetical protein